MVLVIFKCFLLFVFTDSVLMIIEYGFLIINPFAAAFWIYGALIRKVSNLPPDYSGAKTQTLGSAGLTNFA